MKKTYINIFLFVIIWSVIWAFLTDIWTTVSFFNVVRWNMVYNKWDYNTSKDIYSKTFWYTNEKWVINNNLWNIAYKKWDYSDAISEYKLIPDKQDKTTFYKNHNLGNTYYRLGEKEKDDNKKMSIWKNSLDSYKKALDINIKINKEETQKNYQFVLDKLKKLLEKKQKEEEEKRKKEEEQKKKQEQQNKDNQKNNEWKDNKDWQNWQEQQSQQNPNSVGWKTWTNQSQWFTSLWNSGNSNKDSKMTQQEKDELTKYLQYLQDFSKQNQNFLRKWNNNKDSMQDAINKFFWNDPFFNNVIPSQDGGDNWRNW